MTAYYNEIDDYAADWLDNLIAGGHIAPGVVDRRSIEDVQPDDLRGFTQCHFFAGIGVWSYALRLAGWPDGRPVWTGSWRDADWLFCRDGKWRPVESGTFPLVDGSAFRVGSGSPLEGKSRKGMLKGYGNAVDAQATAAFIRAYLEATGRA